MVDLIVLANAADPLVRWMYPDPHQYLSSIPETIMRFGGKAFDQGTAYYVDAFLGAALWLEPGVHPDEDALGSHLTNTLSTSIQDEVFAVFEQMDNCHPSSPHWYLPLIAVDPFHQGNGIGTALLNRCKREIRRGGHNFLSRISKPTKHLTVQAAWIRSYYRNPGWPYPSYSDGAQTTMKTA